MYYLYICFLVSFFFLEGCSIHTRSKNKIFLLFDKRDFNYNSFSYFEKQDFLIDLQRKVVLDVGVFQRFVPFLKSSLIESNEDINLEALKVLSKIWVPDFKKLCINLTNAESGLIRFYAFSCLFPKEDGEVRLPWSPEVISLIIQGLKDSDWIVKEHILKIIPLYEEEKKEKKVFFTVLFLLKSDNLDVLSSTYRLIYWYKDRRSLSLLYKRLHYALSDLEIILIIRELSYYKDKRTKRFLEDYRKKTKNLLVHAELDKALKE